MYKSDHMEIMVAGGQGPAQSNANFNFNQLKLPKESGSVAGITPCAVRPRRIRRASADTD